MPNRDSEYAREGTAAHALAALSLSSGLSPSWYVGTTLEEIEVTDEMARAVEVYTSYIRDRLSRRPDGAAQFFVEQQFNLQSLNPPGQLYGTADFVLWDDETGVLEVVDLKYGAGVVVEVEDNSQAMYYALGAVVALQEVPEWVRVTIVQPRAEHEDGPIRSYEFDWPTLVAFKRTLFAAAERTKDPNAPLVVGSHCRFCPASAVCPAQMAQAQEIARTEFSALPMLHEEQVPVRHLTPDEVATIIRAAPQIKAWLDAVAEFARDELHAGRPVPGFKLVEGRGNRSWHDEERAQKALRGLGIEPFKRVMLSPAQAEAALSEIGEELDSALVKVTRGVTIAPEDSKKPALIGAKDEFEAAPPPAPTPTPKRRKGKAKHAE